MKVAICTHAPHEVHLFRPAMQRLADEGHEFLFVARDYSITLELLRRLDLPHKSMGPTRQGLVGKLIEQPQLVYNATRILKKWRPDIILGDSTLGWSAKLLGVPSLAFCDGDAPGIYDKIYRYAYWSDFIFTPREFRAPIGEKQIRYDGFQELAYLDPLYFRPNKSIYEALGIPAGERYALLRFNAFDAASHDAGLRGMSYDMKRELVRELSREMHVVISSEGGLPRDLLQYVVKAPVERIHDVLYHADIFLGETAMVTESAILGTPSVLLYPSARERLPTNWKVLERHGLLRIYDNPHGALQETLAISRDASSKKMWRERSQALLARCIDVTAMIRDVTLRYASGGTLSADLDMHRYARGGEPMN